MNYQFVDLMHYYLHACSAKDDLKRSIKKILDKYRWTSALDCSCGTGFTLLDLIKDGYRITCADGSQDMLKRFEINAASMGLDIKPLCINWLDLGKIFYRTFDLVMCRGNSLVYANVWDAEAVCNNHSVIATCVGNMFSTVRPGGILYVDIPSEEHLKSDEVKTANYRPVVVDGCTVQVNEVIWNDSTRRVRKWEVDITVNEHTYNFTRYSRHIYEDEFTDILKTTGFEDIERHNVVGERNHYSVFSARRPS